MKRLLVPMFFAFTFMACSNKTSLKAPQLLTAEDSLSYALGINIGESLQKQGIENLNTDIISTAIHQAFADDSSIL
ncbi:MAG TPA: FKBP-type peptidyl-prolyl cis-trans isomerase N-terminal domain-containing protein, partial [Chitinophagales bacterium]|nr:FKBP-type peptidyl-prolyl cis-trans isomerase N-terminal domain-containing protein [Chitinophagales bacterium]